MKPWWEMTEEDIAACLEATSWCPAELCQFRGGGYSSHFKTDAEMPLTMVRVNLVEGVGPVMQIAEGKSITLPEDVHKKIDDRTDPTWPTTWFVPRTTGEGAFRDVYSVMANWGANHGAFIHGHIGADLITLASMLRIPSPCPACPQTSHTFHALRHLPPWLHHRISLCILTLMQGLRAVVRLIFRV